MRQVALFAGLAITVSASCGSRRLEDDEYDPRECWTDLVGWWNAELWVGAAEKGECADPLGTDKRFEIRKIPYDDRDEDNHNIKIGFEQEELLTYSSINYDGFEFKLKNLSDETEEQSSQEEETTEDPGILEKLVEGAAHLLAGEPLMRDVVMTFDDEHERMFLSYTCGETTTTIVYKQCDGHGHGHGRGKRCMFYLSAFLALSAICCLACVAKRRCSKRSPACTVTTTNTASTTSVNLTKTLAIAEPVKPAKPVHKVTPGGCGKEITAVTVAYTDEETTHTV